MFGSIRLSLAAALVVAAGLTGLAATPAQAAVCGPGSGVSVVVDYNTLGGGVPSSCVSGGGGSTASQLFGPAGFPLSYAQQQPGFVCRISGKPASDPCQGASPPDAFWSLWWTDGRSGQWTYSNLGVGGLRIPAGGAVAFSFQDGNGRSAPSIAAPRNAPAPSPSSPPTAPSGGSSGTADSGGGKPSGSGGGSSSKPGTSSSGSSTGPRGSAVGSAGTKTNGGSRGEKKADGTKANSKNKADGKKANGKKANGKTKGNGKKKANKKRRGQDDDASGAQASNRPAGSEPLEEGVQSEAEASGPAPASTLPAWSAIPAVLAIAAVTGFVLLRRRRALSDPR